MDNNTTMTIVLTGAIGKHEGISFPLEVFSVWTDQASIYLGFPEDESGRTEDLLRDICGVTAFYDYADNKYRTGKSCWIPIKNASMSVGF